MIRNCRHSFRVSTVRTDAFLLLVLPGTEIRAAAANDFSMKMDSNHNGDVYASA